MANIDNYLAQLLQAVYGKDVRQSIHDSINEINKEVVNYNDFIDKARKEAVASAEAAAESATNAKTSENNALISETNAKTSETNISISEANIERIEQALQSVLIEINQQQEKASQIIDDATKKVAEVVFKVDYITGELTYDSDNYDFMINTSTGELEWSVK